MPVVVCEQCDGYIDLDWNVEGVWVDENGKPSHDNPDAFVCENCAEKTFTQEEIEAYER